MKFNVGDRVKISDDLKKLGAEHLDIVVDMLRFAGKEAVVTDGWVCGKEIFLIDIDNGVFAWHEDLLTRVKP